MLGREVDRARLESLGAEHGLELVGLDQFRAPALPLRPRGGPLAAAVDPAPPPPAPFASSEGARRTARSRAPAFPPRLPPPAHGQRRRAGSTSRGGPERSAPWASASSTARRSNRRDSRCSGNARPARGSVVRGWPVRDCRRPTYAAAPPQDLHASGRAERRPPRGVSPPPQPRSQYSPDVRTSARRAHAAAEPSHPEPSSPAAPIDAHPRADCSTWNKRHRSSPGPECSTWNTPRVCCRAAVRDVPRGTGCPVRGIGQIPGAASQGPGQARLNLKGPEENSPCVMNRRGARSPWKPGP